MTAVVVAALNYVRQATPGPIDMWAGLALAALYSLNARLLFSADAQSVALKTGIEHIT
jgi:hypothetical protein